MLASSLSLLFLLLGILESRKVHKFSSRHTESIGSI